jgi:hypothetical protein
VPDEEALELIEHQPETALKVELYKLTRLRFGTEGTVAALTVVALVALLGVAILVSTLTNTGVGVAITTALFGATGFGLARMVTDLLEDNRREALRRELGDLVEQKADGDLTEKGTAVWNQLDELRQQGPLRISGSTTPKDALAARAQEVRKTLGAGATPALDAGDGAPRPDAAAGPAAPLDT